MILDKMVFCLIRSCRLDNTSGLGAGYVTKAIQLVNKGYSDGCYMGRWLQNE